MGVRHSDLRLDQWLLDNDMDARLSDFNGSGYNARAALGLEGSKALGHKESSYYLPRDPTTDNRNESDLFALGSVLYELNNMIRDESAELSDAQRGRVDAGTNEQQHGGYRVGARFRAARAWGDHPAKGLSKAAPEPAERGNPLAVPLLKFIKSLRENTVLLSNLLYRDLLISSYLSLIYLLKTLAVRDLDIPGVG